MAVVVADALSVAAGTRGVVSRRLAVDRRSGIVEQRVGASAVVLDAVPRPGQIGLSQRVHDPHHLAAVDRGAVRVPEPAHDHRITPHEPSQLILVADHEIGVIKAAHIRRELVQRITGQIPAPQAQITGEVRAGDDDRLPRAGGTDGVHDALIPGRLILPNLTVP